MPFFSIIISTYNRADKLRRALESIKAQEYRDFEVIVCDDGSCDHTEKVVKSFSQDFPIIYSRGENWGGPARPRNNGIRLATGKWICMLDDDDWWYPNKLTKVNMFTLQADVIYHSLDAFTPNGKKYFKIKGRVLNRPCFVDLMVNGNGLNNSSVSINADVLKKVGGFSEEKELISAEDYDLWLEVSRVTERFLYIPDSLGAYWQDEENITVLSEKYIDISMFIFEKFKSYLNEEEKYQAEGFLFYLKAKIMIRVGKCNKGMLFLKQAIKQGNIHIKVRGFISLLLLWFKNLGRNYALDY